MKNFYENKVVLVTGGAGSIGTAIVKTLLSYNPKTIRVLDIDETALFNLKHGIGSDMTRFLIGDVRDKERLTRAVEDVDVVFHSAALKHVPLCESNPFEAVHTNVLGTKNLIEAAMDEKVERFITISTDKAVNPINVLGASKLLAERLTVSANMYKGKRETAYSCVRFGNVLNSQGSVLPTFSEQVKRGGPLTVTDEGMTRFVMSIDKAAYLVLKAAQISCGGEIFILKMSALRVKDLARAVIEEFAPVHGYSIDDIKIEIIGKRDGERLYEELMNEDEADISCETEDMFILPSADIKRNSKGGGTKIYKSKDGDLMSVSEIRKMISEILNHDAETRKEVDEDKGPVDRVWVGGKGV